MSIRLCISNAVRLTAALVGAGLLASCISTPETQASPDTLPTNTLYQSQHCGLPEPTLYVLSSAADWDNLLTRLHSATPLGPAPVVARPAPGEIAVVVAWGQQPTGAHTLALSSDQATLSHGTLSLPIDFLEPKPGRMANQMLVSPCLILSVPDSTAISRIEAGSLSTAR